MCSLGARLVDRIIDPMVWPTLRRGRMFIPTYDVGGTECMVVTREDAVGWLLYCHGNSVSLSDLHDSGIPQRMVEACRCNFVAPAYPDKLYNGKGHDDAVVDAVRRAYDQLRADTQSPVYVVGRSIGVGVALQACAQAVPAGLVLISGFASLKAMAPWGLQWALPARFDNLAAIQHLQSVPKLIVHGDKYELVPVGNACALDRVSDNCTLRRVPDMTHVPSVDNIHEICRCMRTLIQTHNTSAAQHHHYLLWKT